ncbi:MAG: HTD2 family dehydratase [Casimicrobiaceae bacterium]
MLDDWLGKTQTLSDVVTAAPCTALAATLDHPGERPAPGAPLPPLWHWLYFLPMHRQSELGTDGHPQRGGFLPPVSLPRRMWAGSQLEFHKPLRVGDAITRVSTIESVTGKHGHTGHLVFIKVRHQIRVQGDADVAITELHDIVFRDAPQPGDAATPPKPAPGDETWERRCVADDVLLFRYSALTFNGHRIHYDRRYVTEVEGYPGLVVHGPLIATLLLDLLRERRPDVDVAHFAFRALRPTFDGRPFFVCGEPEADGNVFHLWARDHEGWLTMDAVARAR